MYKIGVLGDRDSIYGFGALGLEVFPVEEAGGRGPAAPAAGGGRTTPCSM